jgi:hypothetical protein
MYHVISDLTHSDRDNAETTVRMVFILSNSRPGNKIRLAISESREYIEYKGLQDSTRR